MSRRRAAEKREVLPDAKFGDVEPLEKVLEYLEGIEAFANR